MFINKVVKDHDTAFHLTSKEQDWITNVQETIYDNNDSIKPCIAGLMLDPNHEPPLYYEDDFTPPLRFFDTNGELLPKVSVFQSINDLPKSDDICLGGEIPTTSVSHNHESSNWTPSLYSIKEETNNDLRLVKRLDDDGIRRNNR